MPHAALLSALLVPLALHGNGRADSPPDDAPTPPRAPATAPRSPHHGLGLAGYDDILKLACEPLPAGMTEKDVPSSVLPFRHTFGRAIPIVGPTPTEDDLRGLAATMDEAAVNGRFNDTEIPAGLIFLAQFLDHDVTLEAVSKLAEATDPTDAETIRTPRLDLDSVYLDGPEASAFLYDPAHHGRLITGTDANELDLPRSRAGVALIGDPRNDENTVIAQIHLLFLRFHNATLASTESGAFDHMRNPGEGDFELSQRIVRWHYQWIVRSEILPALIDPKVLAKVKTQLKPDGKGWCRTADIPAFPIEFSAAAYRFGHSQIRGGLKLQRGGTERALFSRTNGLANFGPIPVDQTIDWSLFFKMGVVPPQPARRLDTLLAHELLDLPFVRRQDPDKIGDENLAFRNLLRGSLTFQLPTGEQAFQFLKTQGLTTRPSAVAPHGAVSARPELGGTPLWFYCLHEAAAFNGRLGDVGGTIVATTILRMLTHDPDSFLAQEDTDEVVQLRNAQDAILEMQIKVASAKNGAREATGIAPVAAALKRQANLEARASWTPFLGATDGEFSMADLIRFVEASEGR